jgi:hypothetical protein
MKRYITYTRKKENDSFYSDPNTNNRVETETNWVTKFYETPYEVDGVFLSYVEYPNETTIEEVEYFKNLDPAYNFTFITEEQANELLANLWDVSVSSFEFNDNRPLEIY